MKKNEKGVNNSNLTVDKVKEVVPPQIPEGIRHRFDDNRPDPELELRGSVHLDGRERQQVSVLHVQVEPLAHPDVNPGHDQEQMRLIQAILAARTSEM